MVQTIPITREINVDNELIWTDSQIDERSVTACNATSNQREEIPSGRKAKTLESKKETAKTKKIAEKKISIEIIKTQQNVITIFLTNPRRHYQDRWCEVWSIGSRVLHSSGTPIRQRDHYLQICWLRNSRYCCRYFCVEARALSSKLRDHIIQEVTWTKGAKNFTKSGLIRPSYPLTSHFRNIRQPSNQRD